MTIIASISAAFQNSINSITLCIYICKVLTGGEAMPGFLGLQLTAGRSLSLGLSGGSMAGWRVDVTYKSFSNATAYTHTGLCNRLCCRQAIAWLYPRI